MRRGPRQSRRIACGGLLAEGSSAGSSADVQKGPADKTANKEQRERESVPVASRAHLDFPLQAKSSGFKSYRVSSLNYTRNASTSKPVQLLVSRVTGHVVWRQFHMSGLRAPCPDWWKAAATYLRASRLIRRIASATSCLSRFISLRFAKRSELGRVSRIDTPLLHQSNCGPIPL
jgi:hypothetical protein